MTKTSNPIKKITLSVCMIVKDEETNLKKSLPALKEFDEVVILDTGSTDQGAIVASEFGNTRWVKLKKSFPGFGCAKNTAVELANNDWVLSIDADEVLTTTLIDSIRHFNYTDTKRVGILERRNFIFGRHTNGAYTRNDLIVRLFNKSTHSFTNEKVHEKIQTTTETKKTTLAGYLDHHSVQSVSQMIQKMDFYSEMKSSESDKNKKLIHPVMILLRAKWTFIANYIFKGGFTKGWRGLLVSWAAMDGVFYKYFKVYVDSKDESAPQDKTEC